MRNKFDICIIGAGAAGLMAASIAGRGGQSVCIFESNTSPGRKLLLTGGKRCNITHTGSISDFLKVYGDSGRFLKPALYEFSPEDTVEFFEHNGIETRIEPDGSIFPASNRATDIKDVLVDHAKRSNAHFFYGKPVSSVEKAENGFQIASGDKIIQSKSLIIATGGKSWPQTGSTGDGYTFAEQLGHTIVTPKAACVGLITNDSCPGQMPGVAVKKVHLTAEAAGKKLFAQGPLVFTDTGISGPGVLDMSRLITDQLPEIPVEIEIDLLPDMDRQQIASYIIEQSPKKDLANIFPGQLPKKLMHNLCTQLSIPESITIAQLSKKQRNSLIPALKSLKMTVIATQPLKQATITRGGVNLKEIDSKTMQSKICPNLFFAGEIIDADGPCGGYNLQIAWSTANLAGASAAKTIIR